MGNRLTSKQGKNALLADRLVAILTRLNSGDSLDPNELAEEFKVDIRTIQRDLNERFSALPFKKVNGKYSLEPSYLGCLTFTDIKNFATLAGVLDIFPQFDQNFLRQLLDSRASLAYASKGNAFEEDASRLKLLMSQLETAILNCQQVTFTYKSKPRTVNPYQLINHHQSWYLAAVEDTPSSNKLKTYRLSLLSNLNILKNSLFVVDTAVKQKITASNHIWLSDNNLDLEEVVLKVNVLVASYFKSRQLLPEQQIDKELDNGDLIVSSRISHSLQILPLIKFWLPHVHIIAPESLKVQLEGELRGYLGGGMS